MYGGGDRLRFGDGALGPHSADCVEHFMMMMMMMKTQ